VRACGYTRETPNPPGGEIVRDKAGHPTGLLIAKPNALLLYASLAKGPKLPPEYQAGSTRLFMREMNRLGVSSLIDAGGGFQNYPDEYQVIDDLHRRGEMTVRIAYNLFTQRPKQELDDFRRWVGMTRPGAGSDYYRMNGAGEMLVFSAADFEDFLEPRPDLAASLESELAAVVRLLVENRWPFRLHATYDESIRRFLDVFEGVNREIPFAGLRWCFDHAETVSERNLERIKALGGVAVQHRMAYQGEYFIDRYGRAAAGHTPPISRMLRMGCRSARARTAPASPVTTRGSPCTGWSRARPSAVLLFTERIIGSTARRRCGATLSAAPGSPARRTGRARWCPASSRTWRCCRSPGKISGKKLMLVGLGDEEKLSLDLMQQIGTIAIREAARMGAKRVAFGAAIRDQGNDKLPVGDVTGRVLTGVILAHDTEKRLPKEGFGFKDLPTEWVQEAGPDYFADTIVGVDEYVKKAKAELKKRPSEPLSRSK
jgi:hypothetical protein